MDVFFLSFGCGRALFVGKTEWFWWMAFFGFELKEVGGKKQLEEPKRPPRQTFLTST
jgi:hypothetical protein